jgi:hypothetical protein
MAKEDFYGNNPNAAASPEGGAQLILIFLMVELMSLQVLILMRLQIYFI